jgi:hypothetical protein
LNSRLRRHLTTMDWQSPLDKESLADEVSAFFRPLHEHMAPILSVSI